jgi:predicted nucleic acid-binding protein
MPASASKRRKANPQSAFWDSSAIVPLCCQQPQTKAARQALRLYPRIVVSWATSVECKSALHRLERDRELTHQQAQQSLQILERHRQYWLEVAPLEELINMAERLLGLHSLRAADSLQLAAAMIWCNQHPRGRSFISGVEKLLEAADKEGFTGIDL